MSTVLSPPNWLARRDKHRDRVSALLAPYVQQRARGRPDPVIDFLFTYYNLAPGQLRCWHPGFNVTLTGPEAAEYEDRRGYCLSDTGVSVDPEHLARRRSTIEYVAELMAATASRPANLACFGLHEWAMVYRSDRDELRHRVPLRLGSAGTDALVESMPLRCTHFDAFRFFTDPAQRRNAAQLSRPGQVATEQPGCLHAGMDLYRFAAKLLPLIDSGLLVDAFELAWAARELDMRASPYDLRSLGYEAVPIETAVGRAEYVRGQAELAERATVVRTALLTRCEELLELETAARALRRDASRPTWA